MWGQEDAFGDGQGGFENTTAQFASPAAAGGDSSKKPRCLASVTIRQVLDAPEEGLKVGEVHVQTVRICGIVKAIDVSSIKLTYTIEDNTGVINGISFLEGDNESTVPVVENTYCVMVGAIRAQGGEKYVMVFNIYPVIDLKEITEHKLSVIHLFLKGEHMTDTSDQPNPIKQEMLTSYGSGSDMGSAVQFNMDPKFKKVLEVIQLCSSENGIHISELMQSLPFKQSEKQVKDALEFLVMEGHIYTTIDDDHFKSTSS